MSRLVLVWVCCAAYACAQEGGIMGAINSLKTSADVPQKSLDLDPAATGPGGAAAITAPKVPDDQPPLDTPGGVFYYNEITGATAEQLPKELQAHLDEKTGREYYIDDHGEPTWEKPKALAWREVPSEKHEGRAYFVSDDGKESTWDKPEALAWKREEKGFWYNNVTGATSWDYPEALGHEDPATKRTFWRDPKTKEPVWEPPQEWAWKAVANEEEGEHKGRFYYVNTKTEEVTWDLPEALAWGRKSPTKFFWWNPVTGESKRERPEELGLEDGKGNTYYVDKDGQSTWEKPEAVAWVEAETDSKDHPGGKVKYFFNEKTKESTWTKPAAIAWEKYHNDL